MFENMLCGTLDRVCAWKAMVFIAVFTDLFDRRGLIWTEWKSGIFIPTPRDRFCSRLALSLMFCYCLPIFTGRSESPDTETSASL